MTREERYLILRDKFTNVSCSDTKLTILKKHYRILIDSDRRYDRIRNLSHLIRILEKRDVVSPDNIHCMRHIADVLENQDIIESINSFNNPVQTVRARPNDVRLESINDNNTGRVLPVTHPDLMRRIYDLICREIGLNWKEFARNLKISEGYIDQLDYKYRYNISEMVREVITYHRENCDIRYWKCDIVNALEDARRRDLGREVQRLFAMHSAE